MAADSAAICLSIDDRLSLADKEMAAETAAIPLVQWIRVIAIRVRRPWPEPGWSTMASNATQPDSCW